jgi:hypothetical protein
MCSGNRHNPRGRHLKGNSKERPRFSSHSNLGRTFSGNRNKSKNLRLSNQNTLSVKKNLKEGSRTQKIG